VELIEDLPEGEYHHFYKQGDFVDICAGPHLMSTKAIRPSINFCLWCLWRGSEKNKMLTRVLWYLPLPKKADLDVFTALEDNRK
jgi:threonyl-tRNA synthetase